MLKVFVLCALMAYLSAASAMDGYVRVNTWPPSSLGDSEKAADWVSIDESDVGVISGPDPMRLEVWTRTDGKNTMFIRHNGKLWIEFADGRIVATFFELGRNSRQVNLKNDRQVPNGRHNFVVLRGDAAFEGPRENSLRRYATGTFNNFNKQISVIPNPQKNPERWVRARNASIIFVRFANKVWIEFFNNKPFASFREISRDENKRQVNLRNDMQRQGNKHNFVALNPTTAFEGPTIRQLIRIHSGNFVNYGGSDTNPRISGSNNIGDQPNERRISWWNFLRRDQSVEDGVDSERYTTPVMTTTPSIRGFDDPSDDDSIVINLETSESEVTETGSMPTTTPSGGNQTIIENPDPNKLETWVQTDMVKTVFVRFNGKNWIEFVDGKIVATFTEITRNRAKNLIGLKNDNEDSGEHNFVGLDPKSAFQGLAANVLTKYATGTFRNIRKQIKIVPNPPKTPEGWARSDRPTWFFLHFAGNVWVEFRNNAPFATFSEISRDLTKSNQVNLKNDFQSSASKRNFVALNDRAVFEGPTTKNLPKVADGTYFNFGVPESLGEVTTTTPITETTTPEVDPSTTPEVDPTIGADFESVPELLD